MSRVEDEFDQYAAQMVAGRDADAPACFALDPRSWIPEGDGDNGYIWRQTAGSDSIKFSGPTGGPALEIQVWMGERVQTHGSRVGEYTREICVTSTTELEFRTRAEAHAFADALRRFADKHLPE